MAMRIEDVLYQHRELMTPEELDDFHHDSSSDAIAEIPRWFLKKTMGSPTPDKFDRSRFEKRKPALGLTLSEIDQLEQHHAHNPKMTEGSRRRFFQCLRETMCRNLISPSDCSTPSELCHILRAEVESGIPAPVPEWYTFSEMRYGPRRLGYRKCDNRGCLKTETLLAGSVFPKCSSCNFVAYCGRDCQVADWKIRHKILCKKAKTERDQTLRVSAFLEGFARRHE